MTPHEDAERLRVMEARVEALSSTIKSVLTTLVLRGLLTRAEVATLLHETEAVLGRESPGAAEVKTIEQEMPSYIRAAVGPPPDPDEDDH